MTQCIVIKQRIIHVVCVFSFDRLIVSLCAGDVVVSVGIMAYVANQEIDARSPETSVGKTCLSIILQCFRVSSHIVSLFNLSALAMDHYFAIIKPLNHRNLMSRGKTDVVIVGLWLSAFVFGFSKFYVPYPLYSYCQETSPNYCEIVFCSKFQAEYIMFAMAIICFLLMSFCYAQIFRVLRKCHQFQAEIRTSVKKNRRGLITTLVILIIFLLCWLPYCLFQVTMVILLNVYADNFFMTIKYFKLMNDIDYYLFDLLLLNSILDPFVYAVRMAEIQKGYKRLISCFRSRGAPHRSGDFPSYRYHGNNGQTSITLVPLSRNSEML